MPEILKESASLASSGKTFRATLISEGVGSSAKYPGDILRRDGAVALPAGTHLFFDHLTETEKFERSGNHSVRDLIGVTLNEATWDDQERALNADVRFFGSSADFIAEAMDYIGLSVEIRDFDLDEAETVTRLGYSPLNAVSVVPRAGRGGKVTALLESYQEKHGKISDDGNDIGKEGQMTPEDIKSLAEALVEAIKPSLTELREALVPAPAPNDKEDDKTDRAEIVEAAVEAGIGKAGRARVLSAVDAGASLDEAIKAEKDLVAEILKEHVTDGSDGASGVVTTSGSYSDKSSTAVKGW